MTSFIDGSMVYGSSQGLQNELREEIPTSNGTRYGFLMRTSAGDLLPRNTEEPAPCIIAPGSNLFCFLAGELVSESVNQSVGRSVGRSFSQ